MNRGSGRLGIGFVAHSPLGRGFITGTAKPAGQYDATDMRNNDPRWQPGNYEKNLDAVTRLAALAATKGAVAAAPQEQATGLGPSSSNR